MSSHYALLGLPRTCSTEEVRAAYKARAMKSHPDRGGDPAVWQRIQQAFDTLADPEKRAVYDRSEQDSEGGAETRLVQQFGAGAFDDALNHDNARNNRKNAIFQDIGGVFTHHFIFSQQ